MFCLIVDDFGIDYVGERHTLHLDYLCGVLRFLGVSVVEFDSEVGNVVVHCEEDCALGVYWVVVPLQVDARVQIAFLVYSYVIVFF